jgi:hypothetical protein
MNIEIAKKTVKGNKAYYANAKLIKSKFLNRNTKMKIYKMIIRPVIAYSSETWALKQQKMKKPTHFLKANIKENIWPC